MIYVVDLERLDFAIDYRWDNHSSFACYLDLARHYAGDGVLGDSSIISELTAVPLNMFLTSGVDDDAWRLLA